MFKNNKVNYYDAFIPSIAVGKKLSNAFKLNSLIIHKYTIEKKKPNFKTFLFSKKKSILMLSEINSGQEILSKLNEDLDSKDLGWKNYIQSLPPNYRRLISVLVFSTSFLSGWFIAPSKKKIISLSFSVLLGGLGLFLIKKINDKNSLIIRKKIAQKIDFSSDKIDFSDEITNIGKEYGLTKSELKKEIFEVYKKFLNILLLNPVIKIEEIQNLIKLKTILGLTSQEIGKCHYEFAQNLYKEYIIMIEKDDFSDTNLIVEKFFFLSDRIFALDSLKGNQYESTRIRKIFLFSPEVIKTNSNKIATKLYNDAVIVLLENKTFLNTENLIQIQKTIGLDEETKSKINFKFFENKLSEILKEKKKIQETEKKELEEIKKLFDIPEEISQNILVEKTGPLFSSETISLLEKVKNPLSDEVLVEYSKQLSIKQNELILPDSSFFAYFSFASEKVAQQIFQNIVKFIRIKKNSESIEEIEQFLTFEKNVKKIIKPLSLEKNFKDFGNVNDFFYNLDLNLEYEDAKKIYSVLLKNYLKNNQITTEKEDNLSVFQKILKISSKEIKEIYRDSVVPLLQEEIKKAFEEKDLSETRKEKIQKLVSLLKIDQDIFLTTKVFFYKDFLKNVLNKEPFPSEIDQEELEKVRDFLALKWNDVQGLHDSMTEKIYQKSLFEAMGATGIIPLNYWQGLEKLRKRIQMSENKAKETFYISIKEKLRLMLEKAIVENKKKNQQKGEDSNDDPSISKGTGTALGIEAGNPAGNELLNLVDLYSKNNIFIEKEEYTKELNQSSMNGQTGRFENKNSNKSKFKYFYPVNLDGLFNKKLLSEMYREYLVECFSVKSQNEKRKFFNNLEKLGPILGLNSAEIEQIHSNVGALVYKQYLSQALTKGFISKSEMAFLSNIQTTLSMSNSKCSEFIREAKKNKISLLAENIFITPKINPSKVSEMRKMAKQLDVDLEKDLDISVDQRSKMFRIEIDSGIEKGEISNENQELVTEIQKGFGLNDELSKKILMECISNRCESHLINAVASLRKNSLKDSVDQMEKMLNFGNLLPISIKTPIASKKERSELFSLYQTNTEENSSEEKYNQKIILLKLLLGLA